jgi:hypothetical protein
MRFRTLIHRLHPMDFNFASLFNGGLLFAPIGRSDFINDPALFSPSAFNNLFSNFMNIYTPPIQNSELEHMPTIKPQPEPSGSNIGKIQPYNPLKNNLIGYVIKFPFMRFNKGLVNNSSPYTTWDTRDPKDIKIHTLFNI